MLVAEELLDRYETLWRAQTDPPELVEFCRLNLPESAAQRRAQQVRDCVLQLAVTDLELRYRLAAAEHHRGLQHYAAELVPEWLSMDQLPDLGVEELVVRGRWGDRPRIDDLIAEQFPHGDEVSRSEVETLYLQRLEEEFPCSVRVWRAESSPAYFWLRTPCLVGRQRSHDPSPPAWSSGQGARLHRLIVAERTDSHVSRRQCLIQRVSVDRLEIGSLSQHVSTRLGGRKLRAGESLEVCLEPLGLEIQLASVTLGFQLGTP